MRKTTICICENKGTDQLCSNCEADQCLCFRYMDSTIPLLSKSKISILYHLLCLYRPVCVRTVRKPHCWFSHDAAHIVSTLTRDHSKVILLWWFLLFYVLVLSFCAVSTLCVFIFLIQFGWLSGHLLGKWLPIWLCFLSLSTWAQLFKINDVVS